MTQAIPILTSQRAPIDPRTLRQWRRGIGVIFAIDSVAMATVTFVESRSNEGWPNAPWTWLELAHTPWAVMVLGLCGAIGALRFARDTKRGSTVAALLALVAIGTLDKAFGAVHGTFGGPFTFSAVTIFGWVLGRGAARFLLPRSDSPKIQEARAETTGAILALALFASVYLNAATSKLTTQGLEWMDPSHLRLIVAARMSLEPTIWTPIQRLLIDTPNIAIVLSWTTIILQLGAPIMLVGPRIRAFWATGLLGLHTGIFVMTGIPFLQAIAFCLLFGFRWWALRSKSALRPDPMGPPEEPAQRVRPLRLAIYISVLIILLVLLKAIAPASVLDPSDVYEPDGAHAQFAASHERPEVASADAWGPMRRGETITEGWTLVHIFPWPTGATLTLSGPTVPDMEFRITAAPRGGILPAHHKAKRVQGAGITVTPDTGLAASPDVLRAAQALLDRLIAETPAENALPAQIPRWSRHASGAAPEAS